MTSIQIWEAFYLEWIQKGVDILVIHYETLISEENVKSTRFSEGLEKTLKKIVKFVNSDLDTERFKCLLNDNEGQFQRKKTCIDNGPLDLTASALNLDNGQHTMDIYQKNISIGSTMQ